MRQFMHLRNGRICQNTASLLAALGLLCGGAAAQVPVTPAFTYQAQIKASGDVLNGTADLQFRLYDAATLGLQVGTTQTVLGANVVDGLFTAQLNFGAGAFNGDARWVEIAVRSPAGSGTYTTLTPRQPLTVAPYAQYAVNAGIAENGGVLTLDNGQPGVMWTRSPNNIDVFLSGSTNAGLGIGSPLARLHVRAPAGLPAETSRFEDVFGRSQLRIATPESAGRAEIQAWNGQTDTAGNLTLQLGGGNVGIGTATPHSSFRLQATGGSTVWRGAIAGTGTTNSFVAGELSGVATVGGHNAALNAWANLAINPGGGNVGIGTSAPASRLDVAGSFEADAFKLNGNGAALGRVLTSDASGTGTWQVLPPGSQWTTSGSDIFYSTGNVGIGTNTPVSKLDVAGTVTADNLSVLAANNTAAAVESNSVAGTWLNLRNSSANGRYWKMISTGSGNGEGPGKLLIGNSTAAGTLDINAMTIESDGDIGIGTATPAAKLDVVGTARVHVLTITGGSDVAEPFNINSDEATERRSDEGAGSVGISPAVQSKIQNPKSKIEPGMVVSIDPNRVGELRVSGKAYDRAVAGVISGANGVNPGMVLTQTGTVADGKHPVALTGRVWAWCDADAGGEIVAGDMLTTSDTPGHAMRVSESDKANGAVIGKAMSSLKSGKGMVLVLVNLQ